MSISTCAQVIPWVRRSALPMIHHGRSLCFFQVKQRLYREFRGFLSRPPEGGSNGGNRRAVPPLAVGEGFQREPPRNRFPLAASFPTFFAVKESGPPEASPKWTSQVSPSSQISRAAHPRLP